MNCKVTRRRPHELAKVRCLHGACTAEIRRYRFGSMSNHRGCAPLETPGAKNLRRRAPGKGVQKFWDFLNDGSAFTNYYMFPVLFDFSKKNLENF